jgi:hypothetical protein
MEKKIFFSTRIPNRNKISKSIKCRVSYAQRDPSLRLAQSAATVSRPCSHRSKPQEKRITVFLSLLEVPDTLFSFQNKIGLVDRREGRVSLGLNAETKWNQNSE